MTSFNVFAARKHGRQGIFSFDKSAMQLKTPFLFPVASFMTGTTPRGGGFWKYILQADNENGLMRRDIPLLSQVLHFLDYNSVNPNALNKWRQHSIRGLYNSDPQLNLNYQAPLFFDSGGFKLMWRTGLDLSKWGINLDRGVEAQSILDLQLELGGDIVASLDYPLPPNLFPSEALQRMERSRQNAVSAAQLIRDKFGSDSHSPFLQMAVHGLTPEAITEYIHLLFEELEQYELTKQPIGIAIGSLVPLRTSDKSHLLMKIVAAAMDAVPEKYRDKFPVHVFGITGLLVPFLAYWGIDTFDSSTYAQEAKSIGYLDPQTRRSYPILDLRQKDIYCQCSVCRQLNLREMQDALVIDSKSKPLPNGHYKSKYYADIGFHNLEMDFKILDETRRAIEADCLDDYLIDTAINFPRTQPLLEAACELDPTLKVKASRSVTFMPKKLLKKVTQTASYRTLNHSPEDFDLRDQLDYFVPKEQKILLLLPCSAEKPYSGSHSHLFVKQHLDEICSDWEQFVHQVSLSGLYGPVPQIYETHPAVIDYEFKLTSENKQQFEICNLRLIDYLEKHSKDYNYCVAYATSKAYRNVFTSAMRQFSQLRVLPEKPKSQRSTEFFRATNIQELKQFIGQVISANG